MARAMYDSDYYRFGRKGKILIDLYQFNILLSSLQKGKRRYGKTRSCSCPHLGYSTLKNLFH